jgi:hypothetical protein
MNATQYAGIDYGHGKTNTNAQGYRYGIISQHTVGSRHGMRKASRSMAILMVFIAKRASVTPEPMTPNGEMTLNALTVGTISRLNCQTARSLSAITSTLPNTLPSVARMAKLSSLRAHTSCTLSFVHHAFQVPEIATQNAKMGLRHFASGMTGLKMVKRHTMFTA